MEDIETDLKYRVNRIMTICETIRELWDVTYELDEGFQKEFQDRIKDLLISAKLISKKLQSKKYKWSEGFFIVPNEDYLKDLETRKKRNKEAEVKVR